MVRDAALGRRARLLTMRRGEGLHRDERPIRSPACQFNERETSLTSIVEANGARIPAIGLGTMTLKGETCVKAVSAALKLGYRHLDTAELLRQRERGRRGPARLGRQARRTSSSPPRSTGTSCAGRFRRVVRREPAEAEAAVGRSAADPLAQQDSAAGGHHGALCKAKRDGSARHIGVANFTTAADRGGGRLTTEPLVTNQIEVHPYLDQTKVIAACRKHGMAIRLLSAGARQGAGRAVLERHRPGARQDRRAGVAALARAAGHRRQFRVPPSRSSWPRTSACSTSR